MRRKMSGNLLAMQCNYDNQRCADSLKGNAGGESSLLWTTRGIPRVTCRLYAKQTCIQFFTEWYISESHLINTVPSTPSDFSSDISSFVLCSIFWLEFPFLLLHSTPPPTPQIEPGNWSPQLCRFAVGRALRQCCRPLRFAPSLLSSISWVEELHQHSK